MNTDRFSITLTSVSANNIVTLLDLPQALSFYEQFKAENIVEHSIILEDLQAKVGLFTLREADLPDSNALANDAAQDAANAKIIKEGQKVYLEILIARGNGPWELQSEEALQNKNGLEQGWALMTMLSTNETALLGESLKLGVRIANKAQGTGGLQGTDYIRIFGTWRKLTKIEPKKKEDVLEDLTSSVSFIIVPSDAPVELAPFRLSKNRRGFIVYNPSLTAVLISYSPDITSVRYTARVAPGGYFEDSTRPGWQGSFWVLGETGEAMLNITELLAN